LLSATEGGAEVSGPETAPRASLRPPVLHQTILNPPLRGRRGPEKALPGSDVPDFLDFRPILARSGLASRLKKDQAMAGRGS
jgi:hypothetical protein